MQIGITANDDPDYFLLRQNCSGKELIEVLQYETVSLFPGWKQNAPGSEYYYDFCPLQNKGTWFAEDLLVHPCEFTVPNVTAKG